MFEKVFPVKIHRHHLTLFFKQTVVKFQARYRDHSYLILKKVLGCPRMSKRILMSIWSTSYIDNCWHWYQSYFLKSRFQPFDLISIEFFFKWCQYHWYPMYNIRINFDQTCLSFVQRLTIVIPYVLYNCVVT